MNKFIILSIFISIYTRAEAPCPGKRQNLGDLSQLSHFMRENTKYPWHTYQYNGKIVTEEQYDKLQQEPPQDKSVDPNLRLVNP